MLVLLGNILWFIFGGGIFACLFWYLFGLILCLTVVGIPFGIAAFRIARFAAFPFGKQLIDARKVGDTRIITTGLANFLWIILAGVWLTISHVIAGIGYLITIIGIPFALAHFKLAQVSFAPLGKRVVSTNLAQAANLRSANKELDKRLGK
ncbi:MAG: YccF domain-containing protein [Sedimentisphaerales bacterium]|nr:YccF domain-containing protein [Sedimentisphaerales bacterium]